MHYVENCETYFKNLRCERVLYINRNIEEKHNTENSLDQGVVFLKRWEHIVLIIPFPVESRRHFNIYMTSTRHWERRIDVL